MAIFKVKYILEVVGKCLDIEKIGFNQWVRLNKKY